MKTREELLSVLSTIQTGDKIKLAEIFRKNTEREVLVETTGKVYKDIYGNDKLCFDNIYLSDHIANNVDPKTTTVEILKRAKRPYIDGTDKTEPEIGDMIRFSHPDKVGGTAEFIYLHLYSPLKQTRESGWAYTGRAKLDGILYNLDSLKSNYYPDWKVEFIK